MGGRGASSSSNSGAAGLSTRWGNESLSYRYQMLDRMRSDNDYFLGNGNGAEKDLWAGNVQDQIANMNAIYNTFSKDQRPEWLTKKAIGDYEKRMTAKLNSKKSNSSNTGNNKVVGTRYKRINARDGFPTTYAVYNGNDLVKIVGTKAEADRLTGKK